MDLGRIINEEKNMMTSDNKALSDNNWRDLVGGFILAFGEIELVTYRLWNGLFAEEIPPDNFCRRTERIIKQLKISNPNNETVINLLNQAVELAKKRNIIAHNPLQVQIFQHTKTGKMFFDQAIFCKKSEFIIDDSQLVALCQQVDALLIDLYLALGYV